MTESALKAMWQTSQTQFAEGLAQIRKNTADISRLKGQNLLSSMKPIKWFTLTAGILWVLFLDVLIIALFHAASPFFIGSAIVLSLLNSLAIGIYLYQLIVIHNMDFSEPVLRSQKRIAQLQSSTIWVTRILMLQFPVWTIFYLTMHTLQNASPVFLVIQCIVTLASVIASGWLFVNIRIENKDKRWFQWLFNDNEWIPLLKAKEMLEEIGEYEMAEGREQT